MTEAKTYAEQVVQQRPEREKVSTALRLAAGGSIGEVATLWRAVAKSEVVMMVETARCIDQIGSLRFPHWGQVKNVAEC